VLQSLLMGVEDSFLILFTGHFLSSDFNSLLSKCALLADTVVLNNHLFVGQLNLSSSLGRCNRELNSLSFSNLSLVLDLDSLALGISSLLCNDFNLSLLFCDSLLVDGTVLVQLSLRSNGRQFTLSFMEGADD
jgi:hypothetical protein